MVIVAMLAVWWHRPVVSSQVLVTALLAVVLLYEPNAVMRGSFWLFFPLSLLWFIRCRTDYRCSPLRRSGGGGRGVACSG